MKKLVFGAIVLALSASAFAVHDMHHDSTQVDVTINSTGTDVQWANCEASDLVGAFTLPFFGDVTIDGNSMTGLNSNSQTFTLNSLHYGQNFTVCKKVVLAGGYPALKLAHTLAFDGRLDTSGVVGSYLTHSGLFLSAVISCKRADGSKWGGNFLGNTIGLLGLVADNMTASTVVSAPVVAGKDVLPKVCKVFFNFQETNVGAQRESTTGETVKLELDLEVGIDNE